MRIGFWRAKTHKASEIDEGRFPVDRLPALTDEKIWKGTGGNVEEIDVPSGKSIATDTYTGDGTSTRQIATGFKCSLVHVFGPNMTSDATLNHWTLAPNWTAATVDQVSNHAPWITLHATDGFVVAKPTGEVANKDTETYYYWAISE